MKKLFLLAAAALLSTSAFADSYTIVFNDSPSGQDESLVIKPEDVTVEALAAEGAEYISSIAIGASSTTTRAYFGQEGFGLKFGNSSNPGNLLLHLSAKGQVKATSMIISAAPWWNRSTGKIDTPHASINGFEYAISDADSVLQNYEIVFDEPQPIDTLYFSGTAKGRSYVKSVTINYEAGTFDATLAHAPRYTEGKAFEVVLGPDLVQEGFDKTADDGTVSQKSGIADKYDWVEYINPTSTLDNGKAEVQTSNRWTNYDPSYEDYNVGEGANWIQVYGENGSTKSPVLSAAWGKYMVFYVKEATKLSFLGVGSASGSADDGNCLRVVATSEDNEIIEVNSTPGKIYGKGTASDTVSVNLNPEKAYKITVKGDETAQKDIMLAGIQIYGVSTAAGLAPKAPAAPAYAYWETVKGPDLLTTKTKTGEDGTAAEKPAIGVDWAEYINPTSTLDDGTAEVQASNRWTDLNPETHVRGEWLQVTGDNGSVSSPVVSAQWGKYIKFYIKDTKKFTVFATGSASGSAEDGNYLKVTAKPYNSSTAITAQTEPGTIYGKGTASDCVAVELNPAEKYEIVVEGAPDVNKDIMITGLNLQSVEDVENEMAEKGTLNIAIEKAEYSEEDSCYYVRLAEGKTYTLKGEAPLKTDAYGIVGNKATVITDATGQIAVQAALVVSDLSFDCSASTVAPIAMSATPDPALYSFHDVVVRTDTLKDMAGNDSIVDVIESQPVFEGANQKVYYSLTVGLERCNFANLGTSLFSANKQPWALSYLMLNECIVQNNQTGGKAIISFEDGGNSIKNIFISYSTFYNVNDTTDYYFLRFNNASNAQAKKVWGTDYKDMTWGMVNNTFVNYPSNKNFANNYVNTKDVTATWTGNVFVNTYRLQKAIGGSCNYETDSTNVIQKGINEIDDTDASKFAVVDSTMNIQYSNLPALDLNNPEALKEYFSPWESSYAALVRAGDPRWAVEYVDPIIVGIEKVENEQNVGTSQTFNISGQRAAKAQGLIIRNGRIEYLK